MIDYVQFPGLAGVYLEDSYVLSVSEAAGQLTFELDAVLTPESPAYQAPRPGKQYCYANGKLIFPNVVSIEWVTRSESRYTTRPASRTSATWTSSRSTVRPSSSRVTGGRFE